MPSQGGTFHTWREMPVHRQELLTIQVEYGHLTSSVTIVWKVSNSLCASIIVFPFNASVIKEADAWEIAQPHPMKLMS